MDLLYHHCMPLEQVVFGKIDADPKFTESGGNFGDDRKAYRWLENEVGFYPLFLSVGDNKEELYMKGYFNQWRRVIEESKDGNKYRKKGEFPNEVLFSFEEIDGVFSDFLKWYTVLNKVDDNQAPNVSQTQLVGHFPSRFQVDFQRVLFMVPLADEAAGVNVDHHHGFGVLEDQVATAFEPHLTLEGFLDLGLDLMAGENRGFPPVILHEVHL